jgi:hypothetical protein
MLAITLVVLSVVAQSDAGNLVPLPNTRLSKGDEVYLYRRNKQGKLAEIPGTDDIFDYWKMCKCLLADDSDGFTEMVKEKKIKFYPSGSVVRILDLTSQNGAEVRILEDDTSKPSTKVIFVYRDHARHCTIVYPKKRKK